MQRQGGTNCPTNWDSGPSPEVKKVKTYIKICDARIQSAPGGLHREKVLRLSRPKSEQINYQLTVNFTIFCGEIDRHVVNPSNKDYSA